jgi:hypothetical protein
MVRLIITALPVAVPIKAKVLGVICWFHVDNPNAGTGWDWGLMRSVMGRYVALLLWPAHLSADIVLTNRSKCSGIGLADAIVTLMTPAAVRMSRTCFVRRHHLPAVANCSSRRERSRLVRGP